MADRPVGSAPTSSTVRYPLGPLASAMGCSLDRAGRLLGLSGSTQQEYQKLGVTARVADRLAVKAGFHAANVWPELLDEAIVEVERECAAPDCPVRFVPPATGRGQKQRRYHARSCQVRTNRRLRYQSDEVERERRKAQARRYKAEVRELKLKRAA